MQITIEEAKALLKEYGFKEAGAGKVYTLYKSEYGRVKIFNNAVRYNISAHHPEWNIRLKSYTVKSFKNLLKKMIEMDDYKAQGERDAAETMKVHRQTLQDTIESCEEMKDYHYEFIEGKWSTFIYAEVQVNDITLHLCPVRDCSVKMGDKYHRVSLSKAIRIAELITE